MTLDNINMLSSSPSSLASSLSSISLNPTPRSLRHLAPADMSSPPTLSISPLGFIHVLEFYPTEGELDVPVSVRIHFDYHTPQDVYLRLVFGETTSVATNVRELPDLSYGRWMLEAAAPALDAFTPGSAVRVRVQAVTKDDTVLDTAMVGDFTYWAEGATSSHSPITRSPRKIEKEIDAAPSDHVVLRRRSKSNLNLRRRAHSPTAADIELMPRPARSSQKNQLRRRPKLSPARRSRHALSRESPEASYELPTPALDFVTPLEAMCVDWDASEIRNGRRLVRFFKVRDEHKLIVSCEAIPQEAYRESDAVISCIYMDETDSCYVTSVDIIYLLERLSNDEFPVEEKNRIRRNLAGLSPITVTKQKHFFTPFFQRIMDFPDPKPRNIEKDLKVFEWTSLVQALERILAKYEWAESYSPTDSTISLPDTVPDSPQLVHASSSTYHSPEYTGSDSGFIVVDNNEIPDSIAKYEPTLDVLLFESAAIDDSSYDAAPTSASTSLFPLSPTELSQGHGHDSLYQNWAGVHSVPHVGDFQTVTAFQSTDMQEYDGMDYGAYAHDTLVREGSSANISIPYV